MEHMLEEHVDETPEHALAGEQRGGGTGTLRGIRNASLTASMVSSRFQSEAGVRHTPAVTAPRAVAALTPPRDTNAQGRHEVEALPLPIRSRDAHVREGLPQPCATAHPSRCTISRRPHGRHPLSLSQPMYITDTGHEIPPVGRARGGLRSTEPQI